MLLLILVLALFIGIWFSGFASYFIKSLSFKFGKFGTGSLLDGREYLEFATISPKSVWITGIVNHRNGESLYVWTNGGVKKYILTDKTVYAKRYKCFKVTDQMSPFDPSKPITLYSEEIVDQKERDAFFRTGDFVLLDIVPEGSSLTEVKTAFGMDFELFVKGRKVVKCPK